MRNAPITKAEQKQLTEKGTGFYAHQMPNRANRRYSLRQRVGSKNSYRTRENGKVVLSRNKFIQIVQLAGKGVKAIVHNAIGKKPAAIN